MLDYENNKTTKSNILIHFNGSKKRHNTDLTLNLLGIQIKHKMN